MSDVPKILLADGRRIPQLGFGVFKIPQPETARAVAAALELGYRHIDTAQMYGNERGVGEGIRASGLGREDVFITSKLDNGSHRPDDARRAFAATLNELGCGYVDLFLIHWPLPTLYDGDFVSTWRTLEEFRLTAGRARSASRTSRLSIWCGWRRSVRLCRLSTRSSYTRTCSTRRCAATGRSTGSRPKPGPRLRGASAAARSRDRSDRFGAAADASSGRAPLAHRTRHDRVPEVDS